MRFIVTGTPRSATRYAAVLFDRLGIPCTHEQYCNQNKRLIDVVRWHESQEGTRGDSSWLGWTFLGMMPSPIVVFHCRRNPWAVIDSLAHRNRIVNFDCEASEIVGSLRETMNAYCPSVASYDEPIDRAAEFMLRWNESIESALETYGNTITAMSYCVEHLDLPTVNCMLTLLGESRDEDVIRHALDPELHQTNRGRVSTTNIDPSEISNPAVADWIKEYCQGQITSFQRIGFTDEKMTADDLAQVMNPELLAEVNTYAKRFGYETTEVMQLA